MSNKTQDAALLKKLRRKMRRDIKKQGEDVMGLLLPAKSKVGDRVIVGDRLFVSQQAVLYKTKVLQKLNTAIDKGGDTGHAAAKVKRSMNNTWYNRGAGSLTGFYIAPTKSAVTSICPIGYVFNI